MAAIQAQTTKYTEHILAKGETLSMLAATYNSTVGDIMRLNGMHANSVLEVGQKIKIPKTGGGIVNTPAVITVVPKTNVVVSSGQTLHTVQQGETLYAISKKYAVTVDQLKEWNNIADLNISIGQQLAVNSKGVAEAAAIRKAGEQKIDAAKTETTPAAINTIEEKRVTPDPSPKTEEVKKIKQPVVTEISTNTNNTTAKNTNVAAKEPAECYFATDYITATKNNKLKKVSGDAMTFKTASGWIDKKYYILVNEIPAGTIVKITAENGNSIYAKVLWQLEEMKLNQGLGFRISESAAAALSIAFVKFPLTVEYHP